MTSRVRGENGGVGMDDDADCAGHVWQVIGVRLDHDGAGLEKECVRCGALVVVAGDELGGWVG